MANLTSDSKIAQAWCFEQQFALRFFEAVDTPVSNSAFIRMNNGIMDTPLVSPRDYQEPEHFALDYQVVELLRKSRSQPGNTDVSRSEAARIKFFDAEARNSETNDRLWYEPLPDWFYEFSFRAQTILGPLEARQLNRIAELGRFGPGAAVGVRTEHMVGSDKYMAIPVMTNHLVPVWKPLLGENAVDYWGIKPPVVVDGSHHFTVPKTSKIDRNAGKEPLINSYLQLGIGSFMERRLKRFGVDIHDQTRNQELAKLAIKEQLATVDLSQASDLISRNLVILMLTALGDKAFDGAGRRWLHLLSMARSHQMRFTESGSTYWKTLEMFSSMGNGFTFPLETLIFLSVLQTVVPVEEQLHCAVYGDDIILPQRHVALLIERLEYLGFQVNRQKTHLAGAFFESCGTDWFLGRNVRPFYLRQDPENPAPYALQAANMLRAWCLRVYGRLPRRFHSLWKWCKNQIPREWRFPVPPSMGDTGLHVGLDEALKSGVLSCHDYGMRHNGTYGTWEGYVCVHIRLEPVYADKQNYGTLIVGLRNIRGKSSIESSGTLGLEPKRGLFGRLLPRRSVVLWEDNFVWSSSSF